jgi:hypothetical protein
LKKIQCVRANPLEIAVAKSPPADRRLLDLVALFVVGFA